MNFFDRIFVLNNINLSPNASFEEAFSVAFRRMNRLGISKSDAKLSIYKKSIDARKKNDIKIVYSVAVSGDFSEREAERLERDGFVRSERAMPLFKIGSEEMSLPPIVVGSGPAGLFSALVLAEAGFKPIIIERGAPVAERTALVDRFAKERMLDPDSNIQFGAGGAGTFSDGKLITRIGDPLSSYVMKRLVDFGAPSEITYLAKPHVGTDVLSLVVENILSEIERLGGTVLYHTKFKELVTNSSGVVTAARTSRGDIPCGALLLAIGHSARDTYAMMIERGFDLRAKSFSVGMRIEHLTEDIDRAMYGDFAGHPALGHAEYSLSHNTKVRGVYTFCMCPGGEVVAGASEFGGVVTNGMSRHKRNGRNSNSAVVCSVFENDYGASPLAAIEFQRKIERAAYECGGGDYSAPMITVGDFLEDKVETEPSRIMPSYMNGGVKLASPDNYLPKFASSGIKNALLQFDKRIAGFAAKDAVLTGAETRTSAPIRITRDPDARLAIGYKNVYPVGEGAGYAGGITSAAIDGVRTAEAILGRFKPPRD